MKNKFFIAIVVSALSIDVMAQELLGHLIQALRTPTPSSSSRPKVSILEYSEYFPPVTRLQLQAMQTRRFNKSPKDIFKTIESICKDSNGVFEGQMPVYVGVGQPTIINKNGQAVLTYKKYELVNPPISCAMPLSSEIAFSNKPSDTFKYSVLQYEFNWKYLDESQTDIRIRLGWAPYPSPRDVTSGQTTLDRFYQGNFKLLADGLFVDAIQLTPAEIN